ncbi:MAG: DUF104 domain-containing protein [Candidatus Competibacter sp.]|nr:DUF104 domain-containing protein [Candidatus Competibacter sp.]
MKVRAVWENGVFRPMSPLTLKRRSVTIQVPDEEIAGADPAEGIRVGDGGQANQIRSSLDTLLGEYPDDSWLKRMKETEEQILAIPDDRLPELTDREMERMAAIARREER